MAMSARRSRSTWAHKGFLVTALCFVLSGCQLSQLGNLEFTNDKRLTFQSPKALSTVKVPLTISWTMKDFNVVPEDGTTTKKSGEFAVFVDRAPIQVGKNITSIGKSDPQCRGNSRCVTAAYLKAHNIYVTTASHLTLSFLPQAPMGSGKEQHEVTVVLLDGTDTRRVESAWYVDFQFPRRSE